jgi:hypothetical protein
MIKQNSVQKHLLMEAIIFGGNGIKGAKSQRGKGMTKRN